MTAVFTTADGRNAQKSFFHEELHGSTYECFSSRVVLCFLGGTLAQSLASLLILVCVFNVASAQRPAAGLAVFVFPKLVRRQLISAAHSWLHGSTE